MKENFYIQKITFLLGSAIRTQIHVVQCMDYIRRLHCRATKSKTIKRKILEGVTEHKKDQIC